VLLLLHLHLQLVNLGPYAIQHHLGLHLLLLHLQPQQLETQAQ
jgi:hypothetical protein